MVDSLGKVFYNEKTQVLLLVAKTKLVQSIIYFPIKNIEVIGNIHDNPELLKGGAEE